MPACSVVSDSWQPDGLYVACQAPLSMGFTIKNNGGRVWDGVLPFPPPQDLS